MLDSLTPALSLWEKGQNPLSLGERVGARGVYQISIGMVIASSVDNVYY